MSPVNVTRIHDQHRDTSWRTSGSVVPSAAPVLLTQDACALVVSTSGPATGASYATAAVQTPVRDREAVRGMAIDGAFAGTRAWSPPS
jgi:hypothetical protein